MRTGGWCLASAMCLLLLSIVSVHAPERIKLLGLFPLATGALAGCLLALLADRLEVRGPWRIAVVAAVLIAGSQVGTLWLSYQRYQERLPVSLQQSPLLQPDQLVPDETAELSDESRAALEQMRQDAIARKEQQQWRKSLPGYWQQRLSAIGIWSEPWPAVFWGLEVLGASLLGGWLAGFGPWNPARKKDLDNPQPAEVPVSPEDTVP